MYSARSLEDHARYRPTNSETGAVKERRHLEESAFMRLGTLHFEVVEDGGYDRTNQVVLWCAFEYPAHVT